MCQFIKLVFLKDREQTYVTIWVFFLFSVIFILSVHTNYNKFLQEIKSLQGKKQDSKYYEPFIAAI